MKAAIHQPHFFPYPGFFHKLSIADVFVIMDDVQYDKRFTNRNKIMATQGWTWLTVPINKDHKFLPNMLVEINNELPWRQHHWKKIYHSYANAPFFHLYKSYFENLYEREWKFLFDIDFKTLKKTLEWLDIRIEIIKESELKVNGSATERLVNVCKSIGADTYVSGCGCAEYMDEKLYQKNGIKLEYQNYRSLPYKQHLSDSFIPNLSIIDLLFNVGPDSMRVINGNNRDVSESIITSAN